MKSVEEDVLKLLKSREQTYSEIVRALNADDRKALRHLLADLVRRGVVERKPDYSRKKMVFSLRGREDRKLSKEEVLERQSNSHSNHSIFVTLALSSVSPARHALCEVMSGFELNGRGSRLAQAPWLGALPHRRAQTLD